MSGGSASEATLALVGALAPVLADVASADAVRGARATAQGFGLAGLERLLEVCAPRAGLAWPVELVPALDRLRRLAARATEVGDLAPFREADRELAGLADEISALRWTTAGTRGSGPGGRDAARPVATLGLSDALDDLPLADDASRELARRARLVPPVAAALRAALDWIAGGSPRPLALRVEDSLLEVRCEHVEFGGLDAAGEVLASVGANLGPGPAASEPWVVRVPLQADRALHLMVVCGGVSVAIPWHAVLRLHMAGAAELPGRADARTAGGWLGGWPVVTDPWGSGAAPAAGETPLVLVAHGRKRGWVVADRLVWRLPAERVAPRPADAGTPPPSSEGLVAMVETEEGERFWLVDPGWLLRDVQAPTLEKPPAPPITPVAAAGPEPGPASTPHVDAPRVDAPVREAPRLTLLTSADVRPIADPHPPEGPAPRTRTSDPDPRCAWVPPAWVPPAWVARRPGAPVPAAPGPARPSAAAPAPVVPAHAPAAPAAGAGPAPWVTRTALVAEDSITARIFLARLLARQGFDVRTVDTAAALRSELERGSWSLACVDIELPDETGTAFLAGLVARHGAATTFVALVRDADDRAAARRAGMEHMLRKPFDDRELELLLGRLGLPATGTR
jgi:CheY-like chemotaxis protein